MKPNLSFRAYFLSLAMAFTAHTVLAQGNDTLSGIVVNSDTKAPLSGVSVASEGISQVTGADGAFRLIFAGVLAIGHARHGESVAAGNHAGAFLVLPGLAEMGSEGLRTLSGRSMEAPPSGTYSQGYGFTASLAVPSVSGASEASSRAGSGVAAKAAAATTLRAHTLVFTKVGFGTKTLTVPIGSASKIADVGLAQEVDPNMNTFDAIEVPGSGAAVVGKASLEKGEQFLLKATGVAGTGTLEQDAEYGDYSSGTGKDSVANINVGVDVGIPEGRPTKYVSAGRTKWFGGYHADHTYYMVVVGSGAPLTLKLVRPTGAGTAGSILVRVTRLSPTPTLPARLDSIGVPYTKVNTLSTMTGEKGKVYLLQASGQGNTGGNNLGLGDADYMDYDVNGNGKVDIGDLDVDYGLAVDETDPMKTPKRYWWGPWRKDHTYYMLYLGTGNRIGFFYYDVGDYGDNNKTQRLPVKVYPAQ